MPKLLLIVLIAVSLQSTAQLHLDSLIDKINPDKWSSYVEKKMSRLEDRIIAKSEKTLERVQKQEKKIYRKQLSTKDSLEAKAKLTEIQNKYAALRDKIKNPTQLVSASNIKVYVPHLDSLSSALNLFDQGGLSRPIEEAFSRVKSLQGKLQQAEEIKAFIRERREQLKQQLEQLGLLKDLRKYNKPVYYYSEQIKEYRQILSDPKKIEKKALELLSKTKLFQDFFRRNSMLASLFRMPGDRNHPTYIASLAGLQTRAQVNSLIQQQIAAGGPNAQAQFSANIQQAQSQLNELKNKVLGSHSGSSDDIMPEGFKPNNQKSKSFLKRLEYGTNFQTQRSNNLFPVTSDIGLSLGYKLNDKSVIGIGASYKLGWGHGWNNIKLTQEGAGLRSYVDWKIKGSFWLSGGYEMNYRTAFNSIVQLRDLNAWQQSGLIGLSKVINVKSKFFKKTKVQVLWDFLSYRQVPRTQVVVFRIGYGFK